MSVLPHPSPALQVPRQQIYDPPSDSSITTVEKLIESGQLREARRQLQELISTRGESGTTLYLEAKILFRERRFAESIKKLEQVLAAQRHPQRANQSTRDAQPEGQIDSEAYKLTGLNYVLLDQLDRAEPFLKAAAERAPDDYLARFHLGLLYYTTSRFAWAEGEFREVVKLRPAFAKGHDMLGLTLEEGGNEEAAIESYRRAIELDRQQKLGDPSPYFNLGRFLITKNRFEESLPFLQKAVHLNARSAEGAFLLGKALNKLGKETEAIGTLIQAARNDPTYAAPHYLLSRIYLRQGRAAEARRELQIFERIKTMRAGVR